MSWLEVTVAALAVWRVTHLLVHEDGPGGAVAGLRALAGRLPGGSPLSCFNCASVWVAAVPAWFVGTALVERALLLPALSGAAMALNLWRQSVVDDGAARWIEDELQIDPDPPLEDRARPSRSRSSVL